MNDLLVVGGDRRALWLSYMASNMGYRVQLCGFDDCEIGVPVHNDDIDNAADARVIVLPLPYIKDGCVPTPLGAPIPFEKLSPRLKNGVVAVVGRPDSALYELAEKRGFIVSDVYSDEAFTMDNAVPSSEGAIFAAMSQSSVTLHGNTCLVIGFGRIGKVLAKQLCGLGARVTVCARNPRDRSLARALGYDAVSQDDWNDTLLAQRFVFNTVPSMVLDRPALELLPKTALVIDLSSAPYGVDFDAARELSIKTSLEPALPGRYSPETAGMILYNSVAPFLSGKAPYPADGATSLWNP